MGIKTYIASLFEGSVDVVNRDGLKSYVRPAATPTPSMPSDKATAVFGWIWSTMSALRRNS